MGRLGIVFLLASQLACVLYDRHIVLADPAARGGVNRRACVADQPVVTVRFVDGRPARGAVGAVRNGFGVTMSHVLTNDDLGGWVTGAVSNALWRSGYCVATDGGQPAPSAPAGESLTVTGAVTNAWCDAYFTYYGDVTLDVTMADAVGSFSHRKYEGHGTAGLNVAATEAGFSEVLQRALANAVAQLVRDLNTGPTMSGAFSRPPAPRIAAVAAAIH
jgi:hypothetical protein